MYPEDLAVCGHDHIALVVETHSHDSYARERHLSFRVRRDLHNAPVAPPARGYINIAVSVKCETLRATEPREKPGHFAIGTDPHYRIKTRECRAGYVEITIRSKSKMICSHARLERGKTGSFADIVYLVYRATAIADKHSAFRVERNTGCDSEVPRELFRLLEWRYPINRAIEAAGDEHFTARTECKASRIDHFCKERFTVAARCNFVYRDRHFLPSRARQSRVDGAVVPIVSWICYWMKILGKLHAHNKWNTFANGTI